MNPTERTATALERIATAFEKVSTSIVSFFNTADRAVRLVLDAKQRTERGEHAK